MKSVLKQTLLVVLCFLFVIGLMFKDLTMFFYSNRCALFVYSEDLAWMKGKTVDEIEEKYGPADITQHGWKMYYLSDYWAIDIDTPVPKPTLKTDDAPYSVLPGANRAFAIDGAWAYVLSVAVCFGVFIVCVGPIVTIFLLVWWIRRRIKRRRDEWNEYLDADQAYRKQLAAEEEAAAYAEE